MKGFKIPLNFSPENKSFYEANALLQNESIGTAIRNFITLLVNSSNGSFKPDVRFGFSLKNHCFENADSEAKIHEKRIGGNSENVNYYARDLKEAITQFEPRLQSPSVEIDFDKKNSQGTITVSGTSVYTRETLSEKIKFHIWKE